MDKEVFSKMIRDYTNNLAFGKTDTVFSDMLKFIEELWEYHSTGVRQLPSETKELRMEQLKLTTKHLSKIGFIKKIYPKDVMNKKRIVYEIRCLNGRFCYIPDEPEYRWYHTCIIGAGYNHTHLDIERLPTLFMVLSCFRVKYNLVT